MKLNFSVPQTSNDKNIEKQILSSIQHDENNLNKRLQELSELQQTIKNERVLINFKKQRLAIEKDNINNILNNHWF